MSNKMPIKPIQHERPNSGHLKYSKWAGIIVAFVGLFEGSLSLLPRVSVEINGPTDPKNPISITATVTNTGFITLNDVKFYMGLCLITSDVQDAYKDCPKNKLARIHYRDKGWEIKKLTMDEKHTIRIGDAFVKSGKPLQYANFSIIVSYRPTFLSPFRGEREQRCLTRKKIDGSLDWVYEASE
jgi:hypothetical protein